MQQQLQLSPLQTPVPPVQPQLPMKPNPNPNNKATQSILSLVTFHTYIITPIGLNEVQLGPGKLIRRDHTPIITKEECESPRKDNSRF